MFGGLAFLLDGKMFCGVIKDNLMARVGPDDYEQAIREPHARPMDFTGRPLTGFVYVGPKGHAEGSRGGRVARAVDPARRRVCGVAPREEAKGAREEARAEIADPWNHGVRGLLDATCRARLKSCVMGRQGGGVALAGAVW